MDSLVQRVAARYTTTLRVAGRFVQAVEDETAAAAKGPKLPKVFQATPHLLESIKKSLTGYGLNSNSSYLYSPISAAEEASQAVHKANLKFPYETDFKMPDGSMQKMMNYGQIYLDRHAAGGKFTNDTESGEVVYNFHVNVRDSKGKELQIPIEGLHFWMAWLGNGGHGKGILITKRVDSHRPHLEGELEKLQKYFPGESGPLFGQPGHH